MAFKHFRESLDAVDEVIGGVLVLPAQPHPHEHGEPPPDLGLVQQRHVAVDVTAFLQQPHPAQAGRWRQAHLTGQLQVLQASVPLQGVEDAPLKIVELVLHEIPPVSAMAAGNSNLP
ncbi:hypothetical protein G6F50_013062 [Rhizopus delemar]|uniref:Uncharacterized protein n=1 Tax=Rhizopus delemar TaxID=936053 RepID=A0A9P7CH98_9FUNG|nr:hypothetical protein G6F50_013062 [Rhizopus delemar]